MRNALILLVVVALAILVVGALNNGTAFEIDYVAGTVSAVSLFWVSAVIAALVVVAGLAAAWFALAGAAGGRRKLEAELQKTYERLREAEALAAGRAPAPDPARPEPATEVAPAPEPATVVAPAPAPATVVDAEGATVVAGEARTRLTGEPAPGEAALGEDATVVAGEARTRLTGEPAPGEDATVVAELTGVPAEAGEQTAVTMAGDASAGPEGPAGGATGAEGEVRPDGDEPHAGEAGAGRGGPGS